MTELMVCVKCRAADAPTDDAPLTGQALYDQLETSGMPDGVKLTPVSCLQNCKAGCSVVLRGGPEKWTYVYGNLDVSLSDTLIEGAGLYHNTNDGLIPWRSRPEHFKRNCIARIPPLEALND